MAGTLVDPFRKKEICKTGWVRYLRKLIEVGARLDYTQLPTKVPLHCIFPSRIDDL